MVLLERETRKENGKARHDRTKENPVTQAGRVVHSRCKGEGVRENGVTDVKKQVQKVEGPRCIEMIALHDYVFLVKSQRVCVTDRTLASSLWG